MPGGGTDARGDVARTQGPERGLPWCQHPGRGGESASFLDEFGISYPNGRDPGGRIAIDYGVWGLPEAFIVDPAGRITYKHIGTLSTTLLATKVAEARRGAVSASQGRGDYQSTR